MSKNSFNHNKSAQSFRQNQSISTLPPFTLHEATIAISLDYKNTINIVKHRHQHKIDNMSVDESVEVMMDMLCRMIFRGRMDMFQEALKIKLCKTINKVLKEEGGDPDEDTL